MSHGELCWNSGVPTCLCVACLPCWHRQARRQVEGEQASDVSSAERKGKASPKRLEGESIPHLRAPKRSLRKQ
ncbi:MAG: hypothetical protein ABID54_04120 [Pseudomonadota bacterium]